MGLSTILLAVILGFFAILFILLIVYVAQTNNTRTVIKGASEKMPPLDYMKVIGSRCPDYWVDLGPDPTRQGYHVCYNKMNIPINNPDNTFCYSDKNKRHKSFKDSDVSLTGFVDKDAEIERCRFVAQCGPSENMSASWLGVSSDQLSPGYTSCGNN